MAQAATIHCHSNAAPRLERASGALRLGLKCERGGTRLDVLYQEGASKIRLLGVAPGHPIEAVLLNTAGGVTGGDRFVTDVDLAAGTSAVVTTQACERAYRARDGVAEVANHVALGAAARLDWLPQETIVYDGACFSRQLQADVAVDARLLAVEALVLGRTAHGEVVRHGHLRDAFHIRRGGRLIFADCFALDGVIADTMARSAIGGGAGAFATCLYAAPDAEARVEAAREALAVAQCEWGVSAFNGMLITRLLARDGASLRRHLIMFLDHMRGGAIPRLWSC